MFAKPKMNRRLKFFQSITVHSQATITKLTIRAVCMHILALWAYFFPKIINPQISLIKNRVIKAISAICRFQNCWS